MRSYLIDSLLVILIVSVPVYFTKRPLIIDLAIHSALSAQPYYFLHITKTGGTALVASLERGHCKNIAVPHIPHAITAELLALVSNKQPITILRHPIDRFISSFYYWKYGSEDLTSYRRSSTWQAANDINSPEDFIAILRNPDHPRYQQLTTAMNTKDHYTWKAHFQPQYDWVKNHSHRVHYICYHAHKLQDNIHKKLNQLNLTCHIPLTTVNKSRQKHHSASPLSAASIAWLEKTYQQDFILWRNHCDQHSPSAYWL